MPSPGGTFQLGHFIAICGGCGTLSLFAVVAGLPGRFVAICGSALCCYLRWLRAFWGTLSLFAVVAGFLGSWDEKVTRRNF